jgi:hypothetical protein
MSKAFAALTGPYNEFLSVIPLHRSHEVRDRSKRLLLRDERFAPIWQLVNQAGDVVPDGVAKLRDTYAAELAKAPTNSTVYLEWQAYTNAHGWYSDVPKGFSPTNAETEK